eukprot:COSAG06_NODE_2058_length_7708_cov_15.231042_2_plen_61_part_00
MTREGKDDEKSTNRKRPKHDKSWRTLQASPLQPSAHVQVTPSLPHDSSVPCGPQNSSHPT